MVGRAYGPVSSPTSEASYSLKPEFFLEDWDTHYLPPKTILDTRKRCPGINVAHHKDLTQ